MVHRRRQAFSGAFAQSLMCVVYKLYDACRFDVVCGASANRHGHDDDYDDDVLRICVVCVLSEKIAPTRGTTASEMHAERIQAARLQLNPFAH